MALVKKDLEDADAEPKPVKKPSAAKKKLLA